MKNDDLRYWAITEFVIVVVAIVIIFTGLPKLLTDIIHAEFEQIEITESETIETVPETVAKQIIYIPAETLSQPIRKPEPTIETIEVPETTEYTPEDYIEVLWCYLLDKGFSKPVAAGILGNVMVECGGSTFDIQPAIYDPGQNYYGICQWSVEYFPEVIGTSFEYQIEYLGNTIAEAFTTFAPVFGYSYEEFLSITDPEEAAYRFAQIYERCDSSTYYLREDCASIAYNKFA